MTYTAHDTSVASGSPAELYRFVYYDNYYRYCTMDGGISPFGYTIGGADEYFTPTTIKHSATEATEELSKVTLDITVPRTNPVAQLFVSAPPEAIISVTILRFHVVGSNDGYATIFKGRVLSCGFRGDEATLTCEPISTSLKRPGLRMVYDSQCVYGLYTNECKLFRSDWQVRGTVSNNSGLVVTVGEASSKANGWFTGGVFVCGSVRRMITAHTANTLTLMHAAPTSVIGAECTIHAGCDHTLTTCDTKFNNALNFGGFPWMPYKNPFTGDNVFW